MDDDLKDSLTCGDGHLEGNYNQDGNLLNYDLFFFSGSLKRQNYSFKTYVPSTRIVEDSQIPGEEDIME